MDSDDEPVWKGISGSIILINLFNQNDEVLSKAYSASCQVVKQYLRSSSSQLTAVSYYNIDEENNSSTLDIKGVVDIFPLSCPTLDDYKKLCDAKPSKYKTSDECRMSDTLWHCSKIFLSCKKKLSFKTVIILSEYSVPPIESDQKPTLKRVVDLVDSRVDIKLVNIAERDYKIHPFYHKFLIEANKGKDYILPNPVWSSEEIEKLIFQQSTQHLPVTKLHFEVGEGFSIGVALYNLCKSSNHYQKKVNLDSESNAILTSVNKTMKITNEPINSESSENFNEPKQVPLLKSEILYSQEYGNKRVEFTHSEMNLLKNPFGPPMLKLLGFKPASIMSKEKWFFKNGYFLFPNESQIEGSTIAFKALHRACSEMSVIGICVLSTRVNSRAKIVALSPCSHPLGLDVEIGFDVIIIPFIENVRDIPANEDNSEVVTSTHKGLMKDIIENLKFNYKADMFKNPKLESEYRAIEAIALEDENSETFQDTTKPNTEAFKSLETDIFYEMFGPFGSTTLKRSKQSDIPSKKCKSETDIDKSLLSERLTNQNISKYTVPQLKQILKSKDIPNLPALTGLNKSQLVDMVYNHFTE